VLLAATTSILERPGFTPAGSSALSATGVVGPLNVPNPELDPLVAQQARFRISGSGPLSGRSIHPVTQGARELVAATPAVEDAVRGVLRLVEYAAGGPDASRGVDVNGVAFANSPRGHGANTYRAHMDDDPIFHAGMRAATPQEQVVHAQRLGQETITESMNTKANVVAGWINVGPTASGAMLARAGVTIPGYNDRIGDADLGHAIRVLRHEAQHAADPTNPKLSPGGALGLREALAEAHSTSLAHLQPARHVLGLDGVVSDAALQQATTFRPYASAEQLLATSLRAGGIDPGSAEAARLVALPSDRVAEELVTRIARTSGEPASAARGELGAAFDDVLGHAH
jgi:hypothetical protein